MSTDTDGQRALTPEEFREVIGRFASGVTIITTLQDGAPVGTTASAFSSLSLTPPMVLVCMNRESATGQAIASAGAFAVNILSEDHAVLAERFAGKGPDKFKGVAFSEGRRGMPLLHGAVAQLECKVTEAVPAATHVVFFAEVLYGEATGGAPLAYFRGQFGRLEMQEDAHAYATLRQAVVEGELVAGESFELLDVAGRLELAPGAAHQALSRLRGEGLVERRSSGTYAVAPLTWETVQDAVRGCYAIEIGAVELAVERAGDEALAQLEALIQAADAHVQVGAPFDPPATTAAFSTVREAVVALAGTSGLVTAYGRLAMPAILLRLSQPHAVNETDAAFAADNRELLDALRAKDLDRAREVLARYYERVESALRDALEEG
jgi:flavin reductase (DIM6/NTAB) family NADH-FMN oxidoreductase RutF/DNA-binding FadR family transcriptional regulator